MAEVTHESPDVIAKELMLEAMRQKYVPVPAGREPKVMGERIGKLYKVILKHVREANIDKIYE